MYTYPMTTVLLKDRLKLRLTDACMFALGVAAFQLKFGPVEYCIRWTVSLNVSHTDYMYQFINPSIDYMFPLSIMIFCSSWK